MLIDANNIKKLKGANRNKTSVDQSIKMGGGREVVNTRKTCKEKFLSIHVQISCIRISDLKEGHLK